MCWKVCAFSRLSTRTKFHVDLKVLTDIDADDLNACLKEFNEQQLNTVDVEGVRVGTFL